MSSDSGYLGRGIYSISEASHLSGISQPQIRRWIGGYATKTKSGERHYHSVFDSDYDALQSHPALSFLDLIEVQFIHSFMRHGVSWKALRIAASKAANLLQFKHPFAKREFFTDGRSILARIARDTNDPELLNLVDGQYEIDQLVSPILFGNLEFGELDIANRWWPRGHAAGVVVDPARNLGKPTVEPHGIPTSVLARMFETVQSVDEVADWYEIDSQYVARAVDFEASLAA